MRERTKTGHPKGGKRLKRARVEDDHVDGMDVENRQGGGHADKESTGASEKDRNTLSKLQDTLGGLREARADVQQALAESGGSTKAVGKAGDMAKVSTQDKERLETLGKELQQIVERTGLPVHMLLQHTGLLVRWTRGQNSWNLYEEYVKTQERKIPFETFSSVVRTEYDEIKRRSSPWQWKELKESWQKEVTKHWMSKVSAIKPSVSRDNASMVKHMSQVVTQLNVLQGNIRNGAPIETITLVYSSDPHMRQLSQFLVSDPNLRPLFENQQVPTRDMIERFITLSDALALGIASFEANEMSIEDLLRFATDVEKPSKDNSVAPSPRINPESGPSGGTKAGEPSNKQGGAKPTAGTNAKSLKGSGVDSIRDYRGYAKRFVQNRELPPGLSLECDRDGLCSVMRLLLKSLFADATGVASPNIWGVCIYLFLVKYKIRFIWPSDTKGKDRPGDAHWDPKYWSTALMREAIDWIGGKPDSQGRLTQYIYIEEWTEDEKLLPSDSNHPTFLAVPIIRSPSKSRKILATVRDCQELVLLTHVELERRASNSNTQPLVRVTEIRKLKEDIKTYLDGHGPNAVPEYHNIEYLNQILIRYQYTPIQVVSSSSPLL